MKLSHVEVLQVRFQMKYPRSFHSRFAKVPRNRRHRQFVSKRSQSYELALQGILQEARASHRIVPDLRNHQSKPCYSAASEYVELMVGNWLHFLPSSSRPPDFGRVPPHCLKKNATSLSQHWSRTWRTHSGFTGRAPGPLSPPTITQSIPVKS